MSFYNMFNGFNISTISECYFGNTPATAIYYGSTEVWSAVRDYSKEYLTFESLADSNDMRTTSFNFEEGDSKTFQYSTDKVNWTTVTVTSASQESVFITLNRGDKIYLRGNETTYGTTAGKRMRIGGAKNINIYGNIMSLIYGDNFTNKTSFPSGSDSNFRDMFAGSHAVDTENLILPATTLTESCYLGMFYNVSTLTKAPALPATTLASSCYSQMFYGCSSLKTAPDLLATTLYQSSYNNMFRNCTSLTYIKCLATSISASNCKLNWVMNVSPRGTFVMDDSMSYTWTTGNSAIPTGWVQESNFDYSQEYLTIESLANNNVIKFYQNAHNSSVTIPYLKISWSTDKTTWNEITGSTGGTTLTTLSNGQKLYIKGSNNYYATGSAYNNITWFSHFTSSGNINLSGNIMSLLNSQQTGDFRTEKYIPNNHYTFAKMFSYSSSTSACKVVNAKNLVLPATTARTSSYNYMFQGTTTLVTPPKIGMDKNASDYVCFGMFSACTALKYAPELNATSVNQGAYRDMFSGCTSLVSVPTTLPATTLGSECYRGMFYNCDALTTAPALPATTLATYCYQQMFQGCDALTTAPRLPATTLATYCYQQMFQGCTALTTSPKLAATTLGSYCYYRMFYGCTSLNIITCLATSGINTNNSTTDWVYHVAASGTFNKLKGASWGSRSTSTIPSGWTVNGLTA